MRELHPGFEAHGTEVPRVSCIDPARPPGGRIEEIADWVVTNVPWTVAVPDWPGFHDRWPLLSRTELAAVEEELRRRGERLENGSPSCSVECGLMALSTTISEMGLLK